MNILKNKPKYFYIINVLLILSLIISFIISFLSFDLKSMEPNNSTLSIEAIALFLKYISNNMNGSMLNIAIHNFILATISYILSVLTCGISGIFSLFFLCSTFAIGLKTSSDIWNVLFIFLEAIGMIIANFFGAYLGIKRNYNFLSIKKIGIMSVVLLPLLLILYLIAAYIESGLIYELF